MRPIFTPTQEAVKSLDALDKSDIAEIRVYQKPPQLVLTVLNAVCILLQVTPDWPTAKLILGDPLFLKKLVQIDRDAIPDKVFNKVRKITRHPDFNEEKVGQVICNQTSIFYCTHPRDKETRRRRKATDETLPHALAAAIKALSSHHRA